jgi:cytochrome c553
LRTLAALVFFAAGSSLAFAADGAQLANGCGGCHGRVSVAGAIPPLETMARTDIERILNEFKSGGRTSSLMKTVAESLSPEDVAALKAYFAEVYK